MPALFTAVGVLVLLATTLQQVRRAAEDRRHSITGNARWIWWTLNVPRPDPVRFFAARKLALARAPSRAPARIFGSPRWRLEINGVTAGAGEQRPGDRFKTLELGPLLKPGENLLVVEAESPDGVGGILFALDVDGKKNALVSDASWRVTQSRSEADRGEGRAAAVWGKPPMYPWGYPKAEAPR